MAKQTIEAFLKFLESDPSFSTMGEVKSREVRENLEHMYEIFSTGWFKEKVDEYDKHVICELTSLGPKARPCSFMGDNTWNWRLYSQAIDAGGWWKNKERDQDEESDLDEERNPYEQTREEEEDMYN